MKSLQVDCPKTPLDGAKAQQWLRFTYKSTFECAVALRFVSWRAYVYIKCSEGTRKTASQRVTMTFVYP